MGLDPCRILVMSEELLLSFGIALALVAFLIFTSNATLMGELIVNTAGKTDWLDNCRAGRRPVNIWLLVGTVMGLS